MKTIVTIKRACRFPRALLRHCYLPMGRQDREVEALQESGNRVVGIINGLDVGTVTQSPATDAKTLCSNVPAGRSALRHVVISIEDILDPAARMNAFEALADMGEQWIQKFAVGASYIGVMHDDRSHPHLHLLVANNDEANGDARFAWQRSTLKEMQAFDWVAPATKEKFSIESGRHVGVAKRERSGLPYPAASLDAAMLANATNKELEEYEHSKLLTIGRRNKIGDITSINFNGRRIRLSTIRHLAQARPRLAHPVGPSRRHRIQSKSRSGPSLA